MSQKVIDSNISKQIDELRQKDKASLSIAELLTLRAAERTTEVDLDGLKLKLRIPMQCEFARYMDLQAQIQEKVAAGQDTDEVTDKICELIASWCLDESLTAEFFKSGMFSMEDIGKIQRHILDGERSRITAVKSFRTE